MVNRALLFLSIKAWRIYDRLYYWVLVGWLSNHIDHLPYLHIVAAFSRQKFQQLNIAILIYRHDSCLVRKIKSLIWQLYSSGVTSIPNVSKELLFLAQLIRQVKASCNSAGGNTISTLLCSMELMRPRTVVIYRTC